MQAGQLAVSRKFLTLNHTTKGQCNMQKNTGTRQIAIGGLIAAAYVALGVALAPLSFGAIQVRLAEVLTLLPLFTPFAAAGVTVGCLITNIIGLAMGANIIGVYDILFGTAATFIAAVITYRCRRLTIRDVPVVSALAPVVINAVVVGAELTVVMSANGFEPGIFVFNLISVGAGQAVACLVIGLPLVQYLKKSGLAEKIFGGSGNLNMVSQ